MKILIIPDIHGRDFWIEPCSHYDDFDLIVFLGDYHDPYPYEVTTEQSLQNLREKLVPFIKEHRNKVICLKGNHDLNYIGVPTADRFDYYNSEEVETLLNKIDLQLGYQVDKYLFTHSGVLPSWLNINRLTIEDVLNNSISQPTLDQVSPLRGGDNFCGSCVWGDVREYIQSDHIPMYYQIFGHTQLNNPIIQEDFACLDCRQAFVLNTETKNLQPYGESQNN